MELRNAMGNEVDSWKEVILIYNSALKEIGTKLEILNDEFQHVHRYNPIEHIKSRLKTPESIVKKLKRHGHETTIDNMVEYVNDIAGVRVICSFTSDIYRIAEMIAGQSDIKLISVKDYIQNPKKTGYRSFHMIVSLPIFLSDRAAETKVEIQIRTVAMDFWASLEHKINYKFEGNVPDFIKRELIECSKITYELDERMLLLNDQVNKYDNDEQEGRFSVAKANSKPASGKVLSGKEKFFAKPSSDHNRAEKTIPLNELFSEVTGKIPRLDAGTETDPPKEAEIVNIKDLTG